MKRFLSFAVLAVNSLCVAQTTIAIDDDGTKTTLLSNIDPSDIASIPEPEILGPPIGVVASATASYDAAAATSSILADVTAATNAQTDILSTTATVALTEETHGSLKRRQGGIRAVKVQKRDLHYPVDTSNYDVPSGYTPAFIGYQGATEARGYLTYKTLSKYDPSQCAAACDKISTCVFMNIYYEKDPDKNGNAVDVIKCSMYGMPQTNATTTNKGQWQGSFHVVITGSNGYNKATPAVAPQGYSIESLPAAVNAPLWDSAGQWSFIQPVYLDKYDAGLCAAACDKQTVYDRSHATDDCNYKTCVYANLYILSQDGVPKTVVCALYTESVNNTYAVNKGYWTETDSYQVSNSVGLTNTTAVAAGYPVKCAPPSSSSLISSSSSSTSSSSSSLSSSSSSTSSSSSSSVPASSSTSQTSQSGHGSSSTATSTTATSTTSSSTTSSSITSSSSSTSQSSSSSASSTTSEPSSSSSKTSERSTSATSSTVIHTSTSSSTTTTDEPSSTSSSSTTSSEPFSSSTQSTTSESSISSSANSDVPSSSSSSSTSSSSTSSSSASSPSSSSSESSTTQSPTTSSAIASSPDTTTSSSTTDSSSSTSTEASTTTTTGPTTTATPIVGSLTGSDADYDDEMFSLTLPFPITIFTKSSSDIYITLNGAIALSAFQTDGFYPWDLVVFPNDPPLHLSSYMPDQVAAAFYDDLAIYAGAQQGVYYDVQGAEGERSVVFEYWTSAAGRAEESYHFSITFYEAKVGVFDVKVFEAPDSGATAYVGAQDKSVDPVLNVEVSDKQPVLVAGTAFTVDTVAGTFEQSTFSVS